MNIAFFTETYFPQINGVTYTIDNWRQALEDRGHNVRVVYPETERDPAPYDVPISSVNFRPVDGYKIGMSLPSNITSRMPDIDIVHTHGQFSMGILAAMVAKKERVPLFLSYHTPCEQYFDYVSKNPTIQRGMDKIYLAWERLFYRRCDRILSPSQDAKQYLAGRINFPVTRLSNGINTEFFAPRDATTTDRFRDRYDIGDGPIIGYCGRLGYEKNLEDLVALAEQFDGEIVVAGEGFASDHYLPLFEKAGITYVGRLDREEMPAFYSVLDAFVIPSTAETQGISVLEANACRTPAVGADAKALRDTIIEGENGYRYPSGDIDALYDTVQKVLDDDSLREKSRNVAESHSVGEVVGRLEDMYTAAQ